MVPATKMKYVVKEFDKNFKIVFRIFVEAFMKLFYIMDLLKIFRMQEPVPKNLLPRSIDIGKYGEVVQEKDILLRNCRARIRELELQVTDLETKNTELEMKVNPENAKNIIKEYETFYSKIMTESQEIVDQKIQMETKLNEMETFCQDLMQKYGKCKEVIAQYEETFDKLKNQTLEYEEIINSLTEEYARLKDYVRKQNKIGETESKSCFQQGDVKELLIQNDCCTSMFEPLKGLDK